MSVFHNDVLANIIKQYVGKMIQSYSFAKFAVIKDYDPVKNLVKVGYYNPETEDFDQLSNWLAYLSPFQGMGDDSDEAGPLWGQQYGPNINEQVLVLPHDGDHNNGIVVGSIYTNKRPPPDIDGKYTESGEWMFKHKSGSYMKFWNNGDITIFATGNLNIHADGNLNEHVIGDVTSGAEGNQTYTGTNVMLNANSMVLANAPETITTQNLSAGNGASGTFSTPMGQVVTVIDGIITNIF